jgi:DNA primase
MGMIPRSFIDDLIARIDLVELINSSVPLKRSGKNYMACCPFHKEKTPSFSVNPEGQFYHCFGCGQSGNAVSFMMEYHRLEFVESIENLASRAGVEVPREVDTKQSEQHAQSKVLYQILEKANQHYQNQLRQADDKGRAVDYLKNRGLSGQIAKRFQIGYAPPGWNNLLNAEILDQYRADQLVTTGLTIAKNDEGSRDRKLQYDRFRDRIIFPIRDSRGRCIGFGGRVLGDEKPKYLNSPETPVFNKGKELYGFFEAKQADHKLSKVIVVEGYMDVIALAQMGINNAVATLGTSLGSDHLHLLFRHIKEIIFCFDGDTAGRQAAERALHNSLPFLQDGRQIRFLFLDEGEDPDTLVRKEGPELFKHQADQAQPLSEYLFDHLSQEIDLSTMDGKASLAKLATPLINQMPKGLFYEMMVARLAEITQLEKGIISKSLKEAEQLEAQKQQEREQQAAAYEQPRNRTPSNREKQAPSSAPQNSAPQSIEPHEAAYEQYAGYLDQENSNETFSTQAFPDYQTPNYKETGRFDENSAYHQEEPRVSAVNKILGYLLRHPELAKSCEIPDEVYKLRTHNIDLLIELINYISSSESKVSTAMILGHWHNTAEGFLLASLAAAEPLLDASAWEHEFKEALQRLIKQFFEQEINEMQNLMSKSSLPSKEQAEKYRLLMSEKQRFETLYQE